MAFRAHHIIGPHGEPPAQKPWFRLGTGPPLACFDAAKDIGIPTPNIHFPRTPFAKPLLAPTSQAAAALVRAAPPRRLLLFYAGWNYGVRMELVRMYEHDEEVVVRRRVTKKQYAAAAPPLLRRR